MAQESKISNLDRAAIEVHNDFTVVDENYGFSVRPGKMRRRRAVMVEWAAQYMGFLCVFVTIGAVVGSAGLSGLQIDLFEIAILILGISSGVVFFWFGTRGTAHELQIDTFRRQVRAVVRNYRNSERVLETHDFAAVDAAFINRRSQKAKVAELSIRTKTEPAGISMLAGDAAALSNLHIILSRIMHPKPTKTRRPISQPVFKNPQAVAAE